MKSARTLIAIFLGLVAAWCFYHGFTLARGEEAVKTVWRSSTAFYVYGLTIAFAAYIVWDSRRPDD